MNISDLENRIRGVFKDERAAVNTDDLWDSIQSELPPAERKKTLFRWKSLIPFLLLFGLFAGFISYNSTTTPELLSEVHHAPEGINEHSISNEIQNSDRADAAQLDGEYSESNSSESTKNENVIAESSDMSYQTDKSYSGQELSLIHI